MGRPREHDEQTRAALRAAAERLVAEGGPAALSVRAVADAAGTSTRAVYSLFGSKEGLLVDALAQEAFVFLFTEIGKLVETDDPVADLVDVGAVAFRRLVLEHPALYRIAFQRVVPELDGGPELVATRQKAWDQLVAKVDPPRGGRAPRRQAGDRGGRRVHRDARGPRQRGVARRRPAAPAGGRARNSAWRNGLTTLVRGFAAASGPNPRPRAAASRKRGR